MIADEGKHFLRISTGEDFGSEIWLGYSYYIGGVLQNPAHLDVQEDFEEVEYDTEITAEEALKIIGYEEK